MATFFGEVVVAPSRAGVDDEESAEETPEDLEIRRELEKKREIDVLWTLKSGTSTESSADEPFVCSKFIVAIGHNAAAFLSSFILDSVCWEVVGVVKLWNEWCRTSSTTNVLPTDSFCLFYRLISDPTVLLCQCSCYVAEDQQFQWLEKLWESPSLKNKNVIAFVQLPKDFTADKPVVKLMMDGFFANGCALLLPQGGIVKDGASKAVPVAFVHRLSMPSDLPRHHSVELQACSVCSTNSDSLSIFIVSVSHVFTSVRVLSVFGCMQKEGLQVTILSTCPVADYKTQESTLTLPSPFLKALKTKEFKEQVCCPLLEQPNIVRDLPAAVLSYCQVWQIPAVLYQCYTDVIKLDTVTIEAFKPLLSSKILKSLVKDVSESTKILKKLLTTNETHSNIYI